MTLYEVQAHTTDMNLLLIMAALTLLIMLGAFVALTRDDRALLTEQEDLPTTFSPCPARTTAAWRPPAPTSTPTTRRPPTDKHAVEIRRKPVSQHVARVTRERLHSRRAAVLRPQ